jgi:hypothetical protein
MAWTSTLPPIYPTKTLSPSVYRSAIEGVSSAKPLCFLRIIRIDRGGYLPNWIQTIPLREDV